MEIVTKEYVIKNGVTEEIVTEKYLIEKEMVTGKYLIEKEFEKDTQHIGWTKFRKNDFELVEIPLKSGRLIIGFEYTFKSQAKYKYPLKISELQQLYKIITGEDL